MCKMRQHETGIVTLTLSTGNLGIIEWGWSRLGEGKNHCFHFIAQRPFGIEMGFHPRGELASSRKDSRIYDLTSYKSYGRHEVEGSEKARRYEGKLRGVQLV